MSEYLRPTCPPLRDCAVAEVHARLHDECGRGRVSCGCCGGLAATRHQAVSVCASGFVDHVADYFAWAGLLSPPQQHNKPTVKDRDPVGCSRINRCTQETSACCKCCLSKFVAYCGQRCACRPSSIPTLILLMLLSTWISLTAVWDCSLMAASLPGCP